MGTLRELDLVVLKERLPERLPELDTLTPFAVTFRYETDEESEQLIAQFSFPEAKSGHTQSTPRHSDGRIDDHVRVGRLQPTWRFS